MTNKLTLVQKDFPPEKVELIKRMVAPTATDDELALFLYQAQRTGLDPLARQIVFNKFNTKNGPRMSIITSIDGYRLLADRSGKYAGNDDPTFEGESEASKVKVPEKASVTVYKMVSGVRCPFTATARWFEYYPGDNAQGFMWRKMPYLMLGKCLPYRAKIETDRGTLMIGEIVGKMLPCKVRSINLDTGEEEWKPIINYWRNGSTSEWVKIWAANKTHGNKCIRVTPDHPVWTDTGWVRAGGLGVGDLIGVSSPTLSGEQVQVILGSLLGDGTLSGRKTKGTSPHFEEAHSDEQIEYIDWKVRALSNLNPTLKSVVVKVKGVDCGVMRLLTKAAPVLCEYRELFYDNDKEKRLPDGLSAMLSDLGVAVWIMDDGNLKADYRWESRPRLRLYTCCFNLQDQEKIVNFFMENYGVFPDIARPNKNPYLTFSADDTEKLLSQISQYLAFDKEHNDKKWVAGDIEVGLEKGLAFVPVHRKEVYFGEEKEGRYDIEVADNHNFIYNNIIVSNCAEALALRKAFPAELSGLYTDTEMEQAQATGGYVEGEFAESPPQQEQSKPAQTRSDSRPVQPVQEQPKKPNGNGHAKKSPDATTQFWKTAKEMKLTQDKAQAILAQAGNDFEVALDILTGVSQEAPAA